MLKSIDARATSGVQSLQQDMILIQEKARCLRCWLDTMKERDIEIDYGLDDENL